MFKGRYGADKLGFVLIIASIMLTALAALLGTGNFLMKILLLIVSGALLAIAFFRAFSRNMHMRKRELRALRAAEDKLLMLIGRRRDTHTEETEQEQQSVEPAQVSEVHDEYRHFKCPKCKRSLKVPVGKGYIKVICPSCSYKFMKHT